MPAPHSSPTPIAAVSRASKSPRRELNPGTPWRKRSSRAPPRGRPPGHERRWEPWFSTPRVAKWSAPRGCPTSLVASGGVFLFSRGEPPMYRQPLEKMRAREGSRVSRGPGASCVVWRGVSGLDGPGDLRAREGSRVSMGLGTSCFLGALCGWRVSRVWALDPPGCPSCLDERGARGGNTTPRPREQALPRKERCSRRQQDLEALSAERGGHVFQKMF